MPKQLTLNEYMWAVTCVSPDDGHTITLAIYSSRDKAYEMANLPPVYCYGVKAHKHTVNVVQVNLWEGDDGLFYDLEMKPTYVDMPTKDEVLKKLTWKEKVALGLAK